MTSLKDFYLFKDLSSEEFDKLESISRKVAYKKGNILFYEQDQPKSFIILVAGVVKIYKTDLKNNEVIVHRFRPTTFIAEMAVLEEIPFPASASFETDGAVILIDLKGFRESLMDNPRIAYTLIKSLSKKVKNLEEVIDLNIVLDTTARLAKCLYEDEAVLGELKNYQLADDLHMTPETLSRTLKKFSVLGLIEKGRHGYAITNREGLRVLFE